MAKIVKKSKCKYKGGYIVKDGKVVGVSNVIVAALNRFEREYQKYLWDDGDPVEPVKNEPFRFQTEHGEVYPHVTPETPLLNLKAAETLQIMDELDEIEAAKKINKVFDDNTDLFMWLDSKHIVESKQQHQLQFDLKYLGNPLELTKDRLADIIIEMNC